jgi:hypothetical protein
MPRMSTPTAALVLAAKLGHPQARAALGDAAPPSLVTVPAGKWSASLEDVPAERLLRAAIAAVRLLLDEWRAKRSDDRQPERAIEAAERFLARPSQGAAQHAAAVAKACTRSRERTFGYEHRIAEAARAIAQAVSHGHLEPAMRRCAIDALDRAEEHLICQQHIEARYGQEHLVRERLLSTIRGVLVERPVQ